MVGAGGDHTVGDGRVTWWVLGGDHTVGAGCHSSTRIRKHGSLLIDASM